MVTPETGEQPEQQPQYGQPQPPYGTGGDEPPVVKRDNSFAVAGITLAIAPPLGLIFSIIGLIKSKALGGTGKVMSIAGIVVSLVVAAVVGTFIALRSPSAASDPGCIASNSISNQMNNTFSADAAAVTRDQNNPTVAQADLHRIVVDLRSLQTLATKAEGQAQNQSVKAALSKAISDLNTATSGLQAILNGDLSQVNQMTAAGSRLESDGNALDSICNS